MFNIGAAAARLGSVVLEYLRRARDESPDAVSVIRLELS